VRRGSVAPGEPESGRRILIFDSVRLSAFFVPAWNFLIGLLTVRQNLRVKFENVTPTSTTQLGGSSLFAYQQDQASEHIGPGAEAEGEFECDCSTWRSLLKFLHKFQFTSPIDQMSFENRAACSAVLSARSADSRYGF
jgi:hypothetical protein